MTCPRSAEDGSSRQGLARRSASSAQRLLGQAVLLLPPRYDPQSVVRQRALKRQRVFRRCRHPEVDFLLRLQDDRHGLGVDRRDDGVRLCRQECEQVVGGVRLEFVLGEGREQDATRARASVETFAAKHGLSIVGTYIENESGAKLARPELFRLIADSRPGDVLLIEQVDRLSRLTDGDWRTLRAALDAKQIRVVALRSAGSM